MTEPLYEGPATLVTDEHRFACRSHIHVIPDDADGYSWRGELDEVAWIDTDTGPGVNDLASHVALGLPTRLEWSDRQGWVSLVGFIEREDGGAAIRFCCAGPIEQRHADMG